MDENTGTVIALAISAVAIVIWHWIDAKYYK